MEQTMCITHEQALVNLLKCNVEFPYREFLFYKKM